MIWISAFVTGLGLGWLFGLAFATAAGALLTAALTALAGATAATVGLRSAAERHARRLATEADAKGYDLNAVNLLPPAASVGAVLTPQVISGLIIGVAIAVTAAQMLKDRNWIGTVPPSADAAAWASATGDAPTMIARRMFEKKFGALPAPDTSHVDASK